MRCRYKCAIFFALGFLTYPLLLVPLLAKFSPTATGHLILIYRDYLEKVWGL